MSGSTKRTWRDVRLESAIGCKADIGAGMDSGDRRDDIKNDGSGRMYFPRAV